MMCQLRAVGHVKHAACPVAHVGQHNNRHSISDAGADVIIMVHQAQLMTAPKLPDQALQHVQIGGKVGSLCHKHRKAFTRIFTNEKSLCKGLHP